MLAEAQEALAGGNAEEAAVRYGEALWEAESAGFAGCLFAALSGLGDALSSQGRHGQAVAPYRRAAAVLESERGPRDLDVAAALVRLAGAVFRAKPDTAAESILRRALDIRRSALGDHPAVAEILDLIAVVRFANAEAVSAEGLRGDADRIRAAHR